jgi:hypothetical protein
MSSFEIELKLGLRQRLKVFEDRVLRRIFGPERDKMVGDWQKRHNEELRSLYSSPDIIRKIKSWRIGKTGM